MTKIRIITGEQLQCLLGMQHAIEAMQDAFVALHDGRAMVPARIHMDIEDPSGVALFMPACADHMIGIKTVTLFNDNPKNDIPLIQGTYCLFDGTSGTPRAFMDGSALTAIRTGAASGLATRLLAREDAKRVSIFGAGVQGRTQLEAVCAVRDIAGARVYDPIVENAAKFAVEMSEKLGIPVDATNSPKHAIQAADIVCTATVSATPVLDDADLKPGTHINAVGSYKADVQEIPGETVKRARVFVDKKEATLKETGDLIIPIEMGLITHDHILELGALAAGASNGRTDADEITLFKSVGLAIQDLAAASKTLELAEEQGVGTVVSI